MKGLDFLARYDLLDDAEKRYVVSYLVAAIDYVSGGGFRDPQHTEHGLWAMAKLEDAVNELAAKDFDEWIKLHWPAEVSPECTNLMSNNDEENPQQFDCLERSILAAHSCASCLIFAKLCQQWEERELKKPVAQQTCDGSGTAAPETQRESEGKQGHHPPNDPATGFFSL